MTLPSASAVGKAVVMTALAMIIIRAVKNANVLPASVNNLLP
jgi:hypothetical protein